MDDWGCPHDKTTPPFFAIQNAGSILRSGANHGVFVDSYGERHRNRDTWGCIPLSKWAIPPNYIWNITTGWEYRD